MQKKEMFQYINDIATKYADFAKGYDFDKAFAELEEDFPVWQKLLTPLYAGYAPLSKFMYIHKNEEVLNKLPSTEISYFALKWLETKIFFSFEASLEKEIIESGLDATTKVPAILLNRCPYSSFFIQANGSGYIEPDKVKVSSDLAFLHDSSGYFVSISPYYEYNDKTKRLIRTEDKVLDVAVVPNTEKNHGKNSFCYASLRIPKYNTSVTIHEAAIIPNIQIEDITPKEAEEMYKCSEALLLRALQYILHLCSENSVISKKETKKAPSWASKKKKSAQQVKLFEVSLPYTEPTERVFSGHSSSHGGVSTGTGKAKAPHVRKAHWAYRWIGSKDDKHLELRWIREAHIHAETEANGSVVNVEKKRLETSFR